MTVLISWSMADSSADHGFGWASDTRCGAEHYVRAVVAGSCPTQHRGAGIVLDSVGCIGMAADVVVQL